MCPVYIVHVIEDIEHIEWHLPDIFIKSLCIGIFETSIFSCFCCVFCLFFFFFNSGCSAPDYCSSHVMALTYTTAEVENEISHKSNNIEP